MLIGELDAVELGRRLRGGGLALYLYPFTVRAFTPFNALASNLQQMYASFPLAETDFADFHVTVRRRRWFRPQAVFELDGYRPFFPLPAEQAFVGFEWGLNWCIAHYAHDYLMLHAAVLERDGRALILPGAPGSGKSTLAAGLLCAGWRLLSDELTLLRLSDGAVQGLARPISLKNDSIQLVRQRSPDAVLSPVTKDTTKGAVCHLAPPASAIERADETAPPRWFVFPKFERGNETRIEPLGQAQAMMAAVDSALNYSVLGATAFDLLADTMDCCRPYSLTFDSLDEALLALDRVTSGEQREAHVS